MHLYPPSNLSDLLFGKMSRSLLRLYSVISSLLYHSLPQNWNKSKAANINSVIFRLDDIPYDSPIYDQARIDLDLAVMEVFIKKNQNVTLGLVASYLDLHPNLVDYIIRGSDKGIFELALHGWDHSDYSKLSKTDQEFALLNAMSKIQDLFGYQSKIFIPPYNKFNRLTISVLKKLGIKILSSSLYSDYHSAYVTSQSRKNKGKENPLFHFPEMVSFETFQGSRPIPVPLKQLVKNVENKISKYGYAIITIHPQDFVKFVDAKSTEANLKESVLDVEQIKQLDSLLQIILDKQIKITNFCKILDPR